MSGYFVEVVEDATGEVVKRMGPMSRRKAERVEDGVSINMNHEAFHTRIVEGEVAS